MYHVPWIAFFFSQQMSPWRPNFPHQRLWPYHLLIFPGDLPRGCNFKSWEFFFFTYSILERSDRLYPSLQVMLSKQIICIGTSLIVLIFTLDYDLIKAKSSEIILFFSSYYHSKILLTYSYIILSNWSIYAKSLPKIETAKRHLLELSWPI